jgi:DNA ligase-1
MRAYWDGGVSYGKLTSDIQYANTQKDYQKRTPPRATGLWSRYGKVIHAPVWWLEKLPEGVPLDGELYVGRGQFQQLVSCVKKFEPVFDMPSDYYMFAPGRINDPIWKNFHMPDCRDSFDVRRPTPVPFRVLNIRLENYGVEENSVVKFVTQTQLPFSTPKAEAIVQEKLALVTGAGGEGLVLRHPDAAWEPKRTHNCVKIKKLFDSEGSVIGYTWGKGKYEDMIGAVIVQWGDKTFELSGFTDEERAIEGTGTPGTEIDSEIESVHFHRGSRISFLYGELTDAGYPREARFWRKRNENV